MSNHIIEMSKYTTPSIAEAKRGEWVEYGDDNNYYQFLIDRFTNSTTNNAIINNICRLIYGRGLEAKDANRKPNEYAMLMSLISRDDIRKVIIDLYMLGQCSFQVHYSKDRKSIVKAYHMPVMLLRPEKCDENGDITGVYYSDNWSDTKKFVPKRLPMFGTSTESIEISYIQPYSVGLKYFSIVDYQGGIDYALLEEEIATFLINDVQNGFAPTSIVNFNNTTPSDEEKELLSNKVINKLTGSGGKKVVVSFNENVDSKTTIDSIPLSDAPQHYQYLADECTRKIMMAHNVTSPLLFGIANSNGFSSNADELRNSAVLFENMVIKPKQDIIIEAIERILSFNGSTLTLSFKPLNPLDVQGDITTSTETNNTTLTSIELGEVIDENEWVLIDSHKVNYDLENDLDNYLSDLCKTTKLSKLVNLVTTGTARPTWKSEQDGEIFKTRYRYGGVIGENSREFCVKMLNANKVYRKEDIVAMSSMEVNKGWGPEGANTYDIFLYKGGGDCNHFWIRETYLKKSDVNSPLAKKFTPAETRKAGEIVPTNDKRVYQKPKDMPYNGFLPTNKRFQ